MSARVLVVDDVDVNVRLLEAKLSSEYFTVLTASSGEQALQAVKSERPDIVLLDVMMPEMDGFEVCRRLKSDPKTADIPVIMVTALSEVSDRVRGLQAGADDFLTKPVNDVALFARVRSLVRLKRMTEEWRLREEVYGRFETGPREARPSEDMSPARIVLWEENRFAGDRLTEMLAPVAAEVLRPSSPDELRALMDPAVDLVILSLAGQQDALRLLAQLRTADPHRFVPILLVADGEEVPRLAKGLDLGANDYIVRPIDRNELTARARTQIRRKRLQDGLVDNYQRSLALALTDGLTGLYNRRYLMAHLDGLMARAADGQNGTALLMIDIDYFKRVNDTHGHAAGDAVLREIAGRIQRHVRSFDLVARYGGEEFVVVMPDTPLSVAALVAERLRNTIADKPVGLGEGASEKQVTVSIGIAMTRQKGDTGGALLQRADKALYSAKGAGRDCVFSFPADALTRSSAIS
ncbi:MAG TPA: PleD family two-component system response regulator [Stellaceae bacterium]|jgi:two-component system cell cycle response regulator|nr:PleD family two-component system response regulator [Stellaceae bacterium]